jgi:intracellular septation protein A
MAPHLRSLLTLSSPMMPFDIIPLILFFICYSFWGLERVQPKKIVAYEGQMSHGITGLERVKRTALFLVITQRVVVISYRRFWTTYRSHLQEFLTP